MSQEPKLVYPLNIQWQVYQQAEYAGGKILKNVRALSTVVVSVQMDIMVQKE